jgi:hypothetical protein
MRVKKMRWIWLVSIMSSIACGEEYPQKHTLKCNMTHLYDDIPGSVESVGEMFSEGTFYGRFRFNSFGFTWKNEIENVRKDHYTAGVGGSLIFKSASINGFSGTVGAYMSQGFGSLNDEQFYLYKAGKDVMSRYDLVYEDSNNISTLAEAYLQYGHDKTYVRAGRQIFLTFLTQSNDTKMIPNTFEGITLHSKDIPDTYLQMAYLTRQKLRDHSGFHHLLAVGYDENDPYVRFSENDDSAMHYGLKLNELKARGIEDRLMIMQLKNTSIEDLTLHLNYTAVPELVSSAIVQADYRFDLGDWSVIPGFRYMRQFDEGAGVIGGANLKTLTDSYSDPDSLNSTLYGARVDVVEDGFKLRFGYTEVSNEGDIIAPWRGFPTGGFTRSIGQYNWNANTKSYMVQLDYETNFEFDFDAEFDIFSDIKIIARYSKQDFDDEKIGVQADSNVYNINILKGFGGTSDIYLKTRLAYIDGDDDTVAANGITKLDPSYREIRFEVNYLF